MNFDWRSAGALATVIVLFIVIHILRKKTKINFSLLVLGSLLAGIGVGILFSGHTDWVTPIGKIYVSVLYALMSPLIIISVISSVTSLTSVAQLKGIGVRSVVWLLITTLLSILLAMGIGMVSGVGQQSYLSIEGVNTGAFENRVTPFAVVLMGFIPRNIVEDIANEKVIPMILMAVLIAVSYVVAANKNRKKVLAFKSLIEALKEVIFTAVDFIIKLTPYAVLALLVTASGNAVGRGAIVHSLIVLLIVSFIAMIIDTFLINAVLIKTFAKLKPMSFFKKITPAQLVGFSTQSSCGTLPVTLETLTQKIGVKDKVANFTASLGTTIGMPGCAGIWPVLVAIYGIHGLGIHYTPKDYIILGITALFVSLGTAGVPNTAVITTASVLTAVGLPLELLVLTIPISSIADTGRTACNITGAIVAATIVGREEDSLDDEIFNGTKEYQAESSAENNDGETTYLSSDDETIYLSADDAEEEPTIPVGRGCM
ncbi:sodium:dicarboxylate symporter [Clostridia bacterium]|nr:sodium:dicarboxylate symporter [Clostridia bacterium]